MLQIRLLYAWYGICGRSIQSFVEASQTQLQRLYMLGNDDNLGWV